MPGLYLHTYIQTVWAVLGVCRYSGRSGAACDGLTVRPFRGGTEARGGQALSLCSLLYTERAIGLLYLMYESCAKEAKTVV